jgi:hypothetical protein
MILLLRRLSFKKEVPELCLNGIRVFMPHAGKKLMTVCHNYLERICISASSNTFNFSGRRQRTIRTDEQKTDISRNMLHLENCRIQTFIA